MESRLKELAAQDGYTVENKGQQSGLYALYELTNGEQCGTLCITSMEYNQYGGSPATHSYTKTVGKTNTSVKKEGSAAIASKLPELMEAKYKVFKQAMGSKYGK